MAGEAIWMDVLPSVKGFGPALFASATRTAAGAGKAAGGAWSSSFSSEAGKSSAQKLADDLKSASDKAVKAVNAQKIAVAKARAAEREATAKVIEANDKLAKSRASGDTAKIEAAEARLAAARERQSAASEKVSQSEQKLAGAYRVSKEVSGELETAHKNLGDETDKTSGRMGKLKASMKGADWSAYGKAAGVAAGSISTGFGFAVKGAADFEQRMNGVKAVSGASAGELSQLSAKALELGKSTVFNAAEAADAISELVKAGIPVKGVLNGAADAAVNLAAASGVDMAEAATIASNAMNGFNIKASEMSKVSDLIAGAANASAIDVSEFGYALSQSSAVAHTAGMDFDELAVAIAEMGNAGIKGSDAGTSIKSFLVNLSGASEDAQAALRELGIITADGTNRFYDAAGNLKSFADIQQILTDSTKSLTEEQKTQLLTQGFGTDALRAASVFAQQGASGYDELSKSMGKVTAESVAQTRMGGLAGQWEELKGSLETLSIIIGTKFLPVLTDAAGKTTSFLDFAGRHSTVFTVIGASLGIATGALAAATTAMWAFNAAQLANPTTWIIAGVVVAIAALSVGIYKLWQNWDQVTGYIKGAWSDLGGWINRSVWEPIKGGFTSVAQWFTRTSTGLWDGVSTAASTGWRATKSAIVTPIREAGDWLLQWVADRKAQLVGMANWVSSTFGPAWRNIHAILVLPYNLAAKLVSLAWGKIRDSGSSALAWTRDTWSKGWSAVKGWISKPIADARDAVSRLWGDTRAKFSSALSWTRDTWSKGWSAVKGWVAVPIEAARDRASQALAYTRGRFSSALSWIRDTWSKSWSAVKGWTAVPVEKARDAVAGALGTMRTKFSEAKTAIKGIWDGLKDVVKEPIRFVINTVLNNGLIAGFNKVARFANSPELSKITLPKGFATGGYTGAGGKYQPAGIVHAGEYVMDQDTVNAAGGPSYFDGLRKSLRGYAGGGYVNPVPGRGNQHPRSRYPWATWAGDFPVPMGTPIKAWKDGVVAMVKYLTTSYGKHTRINHPDGTQSLYAHQSSIGVSPGQQVKMGQLIGRVGSTGNSSGPHLHFETKGGHFSGGGGGGMFNTPDLVGMLKGAIKGPLGRVKEIAGSPLGSMVSKLPNMLVNGLTSKVKGMASAMVSHVTDTVSSAGSRVDATAVKSIVRAAAATRGWGWGSQWDALSQIISRESSWNPRADNPSSTAYGLFQLLYRPGTKIPYDQHNEAMQARDGLNYIDGRYGNPVNAWDFWQRNHWYDSGGWLQPGITVAHNDTQQPEAILTQPQWQAMSRLAAVGAAHSGGTSADVPVERHYHFHDTRLDATRFMEQAEQRARDTYFAEGLEYAA